MTQTGPHDDDTVEPPPEPVPYAPPTIAEDPSATGVSVGDADDGEDRTEPR